MTKIILIFYILFSSALGFSEVIERIVAIVNKEIITLSDLKSYKEKIKSGGLVDDALIKLTDPKQLIKNEKLLLNHLVNERIIDSEIKKQGIQITVERIEKEIQSIASKNGITKSQLISALKQQGIDFSEYQDFFEKYACQTNSHRTRGHL